MRTAAMGIALAVILSVAWRALAGGELVKFPENFAQGVHYATVPRGNIRQELFTSREAIEAAKKGEPFPHGLGRRVSARETQRRMGVPGFQRRWLGEPKRESRSMLRVPTAS
jgi:hypothetical protein